MAMRLGESLLSTNGSLDVDDVFDRYLRWFRGPPHDDELAFDTGNTFQTVMTSVVQGMPRGLAVALVKNSAGINAAHRVAPLAVVMASTTNDELLGVASLECQLTHCHQESVACSQICAWIIKSLVNGTTDSVQEAAREALGKVDATTLVSKAVTDSASVASKGGYAPEVLAAALLFCGDDVDNFDVSLESALKYAGPANYSPVLVGAFLGARFGAKAIVWGKHYKHIEEKLLHRYTDVAERLASI